MRSKKTLMNRLGEFFENEKTHARKKRRPNSAEYRKLENREMLAAVALYNPNNDILTVNGTDAAETLSVSEFQGNIRVFDSGVNSFIFNSPVPVNEIRINGLGGNDQLVNRTDIRSRIQGGAGNDVIVGGTVDDALFGNAGNDTLFGDFGATNVTINPIGGDDLIVGGTGNDILHGIGGDDVLVGQDGDDRLFGGSGNDEIFGQNGADRLFGNDGNDLVNGGAGDDILFGLNGNDELRGQSGNDFLDPGRGTDTVFGAGGNDLLISRDVASSNTLIGGTGNDRYRFIGSGTAGTDTIVEASAGGNFDRIETDGIIGGFSFDLDNNPTILTFGPFGQRTVTANPTGNIEQVRGTTLAPNVGITAINSSSIFVTASDPIGIDVARSPAGVNFSVAVDVGSARPLIVNLTNVQPVSSVAAGPGSVRFTYNIGALVANEVSANGFRLGGPANLPGAAFIESISVTVEAGTFFDNQFNGNLVERETFTFPGAPNNAGQPIGVAP